MINFCAKTVKRIYFLRMFKKVTPKLNIKIVVHLQPYNISLLCFLRSVLISLPVKAVTRAHHVEVDNTKTAALLHQSTAASTWWCCLRPRFGWVEMAVGLPDGSSYPGTPLTQTIFLPCCPLNDRRAARCFIKIGRLPSAFLLTFSSHSSALDERQCSFQPWSNLSLFSVCWKSDLSG